MKTSTNEFEHWLRLIPDDFEPHFIATKRGGKAPLVPKSRSWKEKDFRLNEEEAMQWLEEGGNVAFVARRNLAVIDVDDEEKARELLEESLFDTLTVSTRSGGTHLYFVNGGVENADYAEAVEIRVEWRYLLVPGSYVDPGDTGGNGRYEVQSDVPPALLVPDDLPPELLRSKVESKERIPVIRDPGKPFKNRHGWTLEECRENDEKLDSLLTHLEFREMPKRAQKLFDPGRDRSKSGLDMSSAYKLAYYEFDFEACKDILREYRPYKEMERDDYVEMTVEKALESIGETVSDHHDVETWRPGADDVLDRITIGGRSRMSKGGVDVSGLLDSKVEKKEPELSPGSLPVIVSPSSVSEDGEAQSSLVNEASEWLGGARDGIHVSHLTQLKRAYWQKTHPGILPTEDEVGYYLAGRGHHGIFQYITTLPEYREYKVEYGGVVGYIDMLREVPVELKTTRAYIVKSSEELVRDHPHYFEQLGFYCAMADSRVGRLYLLYLKAKVCEDEKTKAWIRVHDVEYGPLDPIRRELLRRKEKLERALNESDPSLLPDCPEWMCSNCRYRELCEGGDKNA